MRGSSKLWPSLRVFLLVKMDLDPSLSLGFAECYARAYVNSYTNPRFGPSQNAPENGCLECIEKDGLFRVWVQFFPIQGVNGGAWCCASIIKTSSRIQNIDRPRPPNKSSISPSSFEPQPRRCPPSWQTIMETLALRESNQITDTSQAHDLLTFKLFNSQTCH